MNTTTIFKYYTILPGHYEVILGVYQVIIDLFDSKISYRIWYGPHKVASDSFTVRGATNIEPQLLGALKDTYRIYDYHDL